MWDQDDSSNLQMTSLGNVKLTSKYFCFYLSDDHMAQILPLIYLQYMLRDFLVARTLNWDEMIDNDYEDEYRVDPRGPRGRRTNHHNSNNNHDCEGDEDTKGGESGTRKGYGTTDGKGQW
jgi:hypothetical protein